MKLKLSSDHFLFEVEMNAEEATSIIGNILDKGAFADMGERSSAESLNKMIEEAKEEAPEEEKSDAKDEQSDESGAYDTTEELEEDESEAAYKAWLETQYLKADTLLDLIANSKEEIEVRIEAVKAFRGFTQHHEDRKGDWRVIKELLEDSETTPTCLKLELIRCFRCF